MNDPSAPPPGQTRNAPGQSTRQQQNAPPAMPSGQASEQGVDAYESQTESTANAGIVPVAGSDNDPSLGFEWQPIEIASNRSCSCVVSTSADHELSVAIEQPPYNRTLRGTGTVQITAIPVAPIGTKGRLIARDESTGAAAEFTWEWKKIGAAKWVNPSKSMQKTATAGQRKTVSLSGPAATVDFCGVRSEGHRFAFILDISGSMTMFGGGKRWESCKRELNSALQNLPDTAEIFVVLFSTNLTEPPGQTGWMSADPEWKTKVASWVSNIRPEGGTLPRPAFERVFSLPERPDVVYFLTDGMFTDISPSEVKELCTTGKIGGAFQKMYRVLFPNRDAPVTTVNTITLDDPSGASICKKIAEASGGQYTHMKTGQ